MPVCRVLLILAGFAAAGWAADFNLQILSSDGEKGQLVSISAKELAIRTKAGVKKVPMAKVLVLENPAISSAPAATPHTLVELADGSMLRCKPDKAVSIAGDVVTLTLLSNVKLKVPVNSLAYILKDAHDSKIRKHKDLKAIFKSRKRHDLLVKWSQDRMHGVTGTFSEGEGSVMQFTTESGFAVPGGIDLYVESVQGWIFVNKADPNWAVPVSKLIDSQQNLIMVAGVEVKDGGAFEVTTVFGTKITYPQDQVATLDYRKGKLVYLSEMQEKILVQRENEDDQRPLLKDKNYLGRKIRLGETEYERGLSFFARMELQYVLDGEFKDFNAVVGVDDSLGANTHVTLVIEGDGRELYAAEIKKTDKPVPIKLNIKDVRDLRIKVHPVGILDNGHRLNIADARINK